MQFHLSANLHFIPVLKPPGDLLSIYQNLSRSRFYGHEFWSDGKRPLGFAFVSPPEYFTTCTAVCLYCRSTGKVMVSSLKTMSSEKDKKTNRSVFIAGQQFSVICKNVNLFENLTNNATGKEADSALIRLLQRLIYKSVHYTCIQFGFATLQKVT